MRLSFAEWRPIPAKTLFHQRPITKLVLHRTEGATLDGAWNTLRNRGVPSHGLSDLRTGHHVQMIDTGEASHSLWHVDRSGVLQWEIVGYSRNTPAEDDVWYSRLADLIRWVCEPHYIPIVFAADWPGVEGYGRLAAQRFSIAEWNAAEGVVGHQHAPAKWWLPNRLTNSHWDVGALDVDRLHLYLTNPTEGQDDVDIINDTEASRMWATWSEDGTTTVREYGTYRGAGVGTALPGIGYIIDEQPGIKKVQ